MIEQTRRTDGLRTALAVTLNLVVLAGVGVAFIDCVASLVLRT
jgi:hypothetical protein